MTVVQATTVETKGKSSLTHDFETLSDHSTYIRARDRKADRKQKDSQRRETLKFDSSDDSEDDDQDSRKGNRDPRIKSDRASRDHKRSDYDLASNLKEVELKEFQKICLRRRELCKWIEHTDFQKGIKDAFVRVVYHRQYVVGQIDSFIEGTEYYKVDQRETKWTVMLKNGGKIKQFKLNYVSDGLMTEDEFKALKRQNRGLVTQDLISKIKAKIKKATSFQYDRTLMSQLVYKQSLDKIKRGNYKGLNLTDIKITLLGEVAIAETAIREA